ncbi:MAG: J domain-containing protein [Desulfobacterales bacterium]|nr:J domain-containing protein [Desulfobacterales bacterium]MCP4158643.1 J domain-containing protein [Deltaproteobacteria bacterium]
MSEDYYKILGLEKGASDSEIKKKYRKLAMKYHPDKTKGNKSLEEKFKKISEAYAVLSDPEKRKEYDTYGSTGFRQRYSQEDIFRGFDLGDIFKEFGGGGGGFGGGGFNSFFGGGGGGRQQRVKGSDLEYELPLSHKDIYEGATKTVSVGSEQLTVKIPKGMITGKKLRLAGKGEPSPMGGPNGDLYIKSRLLNDSVYTSEEYDLFFDAEIKLTDALLGTSVAVPTLDGKERNLKLPVGAQHKTKMRLTGFGLPHMKGGKTGDLFVRVNIKMPKEISKEQSELIEKLAQLGI